MECVQTPDFDLRLLGNPEKVKQVFIALGNDLTRMVNIATSKSFGEVQIGFYSILDKTENPRGFKGFFDVAFKSNGENPLSELKAPLRLSKTETEQALSTNLSL